MCSTWRGDEAVWGGNEYAMAMGDAWIFRVVGTILFLNSTLITRVRKCVRSTTLVTFALRATPHTCAYSFWGLRKETHTDSRLRKHKLLLRSMIFRRAGRSIYFRCRNHVHMGTAQLELLRSFWTLSLSLPFLYWETTLYMIIVSGM